MEKEIWKDIPGYEGYYQVSTLGRVKSFRLTKISIADGVQDFPERILNPALSCGYPIAHLSVNSIKKSIRVHRLVALTFIPNPDNKKEVNHINGIKTDNRLCNLEWVTRSENTIHAFEMLGKKSPKAWLGKTGAGHITSRAVRQYTKEGRFIAEYGSGREAERMVHGSIGHGTISLCCNGKIKTAYGFIWRYSSDASNYSPKQLNT